MKPGRDDDLARHERQAQLAFRSGRFAEAIPHFTHVLTRNPGHTKAMWQAGVCYMNIGRPRESLAHMLAALMHDPAPREAAVALSELLQDLKFHSAAGFDLRPFRAALAFDGVNWQPIARTVMDILKHQTPLGAILKEGRLSGWEAAADRLLAGDAFPLDHPPMLECLRKGINTDVDVELLLMTVRRRLLLHSAEESLATPEKLAFLSAMVSQCDNNEHVWYATSEELERSSVLRGKVDAASGERERVVRLALLCLYHPIHEVYCELSEAGPCGVGGLSDLMQTFATHLEERHRRQALARSIPVLRDLEDRVSRSVSTQYEQNPYPRWLSVTTPEPGSLRSRSASIFPGSNLISADKSLDVLVAGCGTGQQTIPYAIGYGTDSKVVAMDISRNSLAYAARMAERHEVSNIEFVQGDILDVTNFFMQKFDVIHCEGVLHHMEEPEVGWATLESILKPGGIMSIALYSQFARRDLPSLPGSASEDPDEQLRLLRRHRVQLMERATTEQREQRTLFGGDFFSLSAARDLLFHVEEHRFTIPQIRQILVRLGLVFRGFDVPLYLAQAFRRQYPTPTAWFDLNLWADFEAKQTNSFAAMYQFWCGKPL